MSRVASSRWSVRAVHDRKQEERHGNPLKGNYQPCVGGNLPQLLVKSKILASAGPEVCVIGCDQTFGGGLAAPKCRRRWPSFWPTLGLMPPEGLEP